VRLTGEKHSDAERSSCWCSRASLGCNALILLRNTCQNVKEVLMRYLQA